MLTPVTSSVNHELRKKELDIALTPSGNYVAGGDNMNLNALTAPQGLGDALIGWPAQIESAQVISCPFGYKAEIVNPGSGVAHLANWKLKIEEDAGAAGAFAELAAGAYPAGITGSVFVIRLRGPKGRI